MLSLYVQSVQVLSNLQAITKGNTMIGTVVPALLETTALLNTSWLSIKCQAYRIIIINV